MHVHTAVPINTPLIQFYLYFK